MGLGVPASISQSRKGRGGFGAENNVASTGGKMSDKCCGEPCGTVREAGPGQPSKLRPSPGRGKEPAWPAAAQ